MNISQDKVKLIHSLINKHPDIIFGGSLALSVYGIIDRETGDIDCLFKNDYVLKINEDNVIDNGGDYPESEDPQEDVFTRLQVNGIKMCIFKYKTIEYTEHEFFGKTIKLQDIATIFKYKLKFFGRTHNKKHSEDLNVIVKFLLSKTK